MKKKNRTVMEISQHGEYTCRSVSNGPVWPFFDGAKCQIYNTFVVVINPRVRSVRKNVLLITFKCLRAEQTKFVMNFKRFEQRIRNAVTIKSDINVLDWIIPLNRIRKAKRPVAYSLASKTRVLFFLIFFLYLFHGRKSRDRTFFVFFVLRRCCCCCWRKTFERRRRSAIISYSSAAAVDDQLFRGSV